MEDIAQRIEDAAVIGLLDPAGASVLVVDISQLSCLGTIHVTLREKNGKSSHSFYIYQCSFAASPLAGAFRLPFLDFISPYFA